MCREWRSATSMAPSDRRADGVKLLENNSSLGRGWPLVLLLWLGAGLLVSACGDGGGRTPTTPTPPPAPSPPPPEPEPEPVATPTGLMVSATTENSITWTWNSVEGATAYAVQISSDEMFGDDDTIALTLTTTYTVSDLPASTSVYLRVRTAIGTSLEDARMSEWSTHVTGMTAMPPPPPEPPAVPGGLRVSASGEDYIEWRWDAVAGADGYEVQFSQDEMFDSGDEIIGRTADETSYRREPLPAASSVFLRVRSTSGTGEDRLESDWSTHVTGMTLEPPRLPAVPSGLQVSATGADFITWTWRAVANVDGYEVQYSANEVFSSTDPIESLSAEELSYTRENLRVDTTHYLRVRAFIEVRGTRYESDWSNPVTGLTATPPPPPLAPLVWLDVPTEVVTVRVNGTQVVTVRLHPAIEASVRFWFVETQVAVEGVWLRPGVVELTITGVAVGEGTVDLVAEAPGYHTAEASFWVRVEETTEITSWRDIYVRVKDSVESYWDWVFNGAGRIYSYISTFESYGLFSPPVTPCGPLQPWNAFYCAVNAGVYYHAGFLDTYSEEIGWPASAFIIAHEIGHHVSWQLNWIPRQNMSKKQNELQADCFGGAWARAVDEFHGLTPEDRYGMAIALITVGSPEHTWFNPDLHGTAVQRQHAFDSGFEGGPGICTDRNWLDQFPLASTDALAYPLGDGAHELDSAHRQH